MKEQERKIMHTSFLDENLEITEDKYAISYVKKAYASAATDEERMGKEHGFLIIQKPGIIYRADVAQRIGDKAFIVKTGQTEFVSLKKFIKASHKIIWGSSDTTIHPKEHLYHWTWLVDKAKAEELEESIELDSGPEEIAAKTPILYNQLGEYNVYNPGVLTDILKTVTQIAVAVKGCTVLGNLGYKAINDSPETVIRNGGSVMFYRALGLYGAYHAGILGSTVAGLGAKAITDSLFPTDHLPRYHNCSTWALEKLRKLDIKEINETITPTLLAYICDRGAHMASLYVGNNEEIKKALEFYNRVLIRPKVPIIANLEDCAQDIIYRQEKAAVRQALVAVTANVIPPAVTEIGKTTTNCLSL